MPVANPGAKTQKLPSIPVAAGPVEATGRIELRPVFVDDRGRRRRMLVRVGYVAAAACIAYLIVVGISLTAGPAGPLAGLAEPLVSIAAPIVAPAPVQQAKREAEIVTRAPASAPPRAVSTEPVPTSPAPVGVVPVSVAATTVPTTTPTARRTRAPRTTKPTVKPTEQSAPTASGPTAANAPG